MTVQWINPQWPAPPNVRAATTLRGGGLSTGAYSSLNLGLHVGDHPDAVRENRRRVRAALELPSEPVWLNQVHGVRVHRVGSEARSAQTAAQITADACVAFGDTGVCAVLTADCLPVVFCDRAGTRAAAAHAGWRGLVGGVLEQTVLALEVHPSEVIAWLGPAIEQDAFEIGSEVREQFLVRDLACGAAFAPNARGRWQADLYELARGELRRCGVTDVHGGGFRCFADRERFFSYRRDGQTGRMATLVWLAP